MFERTKWMALGASIGLLVAPRTGSESRQQLLTWLKGQADSKTRDARGQVGQAVTNVTDIAAGKMVDAAATLQDQTLNAASAMQQASRQVAQSMQPPATDEGSEKAPVDQPEQKTSFA